MKIVAEIFKYPSGSLVPELYCLSESGEVVRAVTDTLLDLIAESLPSELVKFEELLQAVESGGLARDSSSLPDWSSNDKCVWICEPQAGLGYVVISNENIPDYSMGEGEPQRFDLHQVRAAIRHWRQFTKMIQSNGKDNLLGEKFEEII